MKRLLIGLFIICLSVSANASFLVDSGTYTTDTRTGLDWLDLTETTNISYGDILLQVDTGGELEEWALADLSLVAGLFDSSGGDGSYFDGSIDTTLATELLPLWGVTSPGLGSLFHTAGAPSPGGQLRLTGQTFFAFFSFPNDASFSIGHALYRESAYEAPSTVPVPAAAWLFGSALLGMFGFSRRKKTNA